MNVRIDLMFLNYKNSRQKQKLGELVDYLSALEICFNNRQQQGIEELVDYLSALEICFNNRQQGIEELVDYLAELERFFNKLSDTDLWLTLVINELWLI